MSTHNWLNPIGATESLINFADGKNARTAAANAAAATVVPAVPPPPGIGQAAANVTNLGLSRATRQVGRASTILTPQGSLQDRVTSLLTQ